MQCVVCATHEKYVIHFCEIMLDKHDSIRVSLQVWLGVARCMGSLFAWGFVLSF